MEGINVRREGLMPIAVFASQGDALSLLGTLHVGKACLKDKRQALPKR
jgi:hypothetical protein